MVFQMSRFFVTLGTFWLLLLHKKSFIAPILLKFGSNFNIFITHIVAKTYYHQVFFIVSAGQFEKNGLIIFEMALVYTLYYALYVSET